MIQIPLRIQGIIKKARILKQECSLLKSLHKKFQDILMDNLIFGVSIVKLKKIVECAFTVADSVKKNFLRLSK